MIKMSYLHISNLYRSQEILMFRECWSLEKCHGTSAHLSWNEGKLGFFSGGANHANFVALFDQEALIAAFTEMGHEKVIVFGEAYGGKEQGMRLTYGDQLQFIVFDVKVCENWVTVPNAEQIALRLGLEFVPYERIPTTLEAIDAERDKPSVIAVRRGITEPRPREGVVLRGIIELTKNNGERIIAKHKGEAFQETAKPRKVVDPAQQEVLEEADAITREWITPTRLSHVLDKLIADDNTAVQVQRIEGTGLVIKAMLEDVHREASDEIVPSKEADRAMGKETARLFKQHLQKQLEDQMVRAAEGE